MKSLVFSFLPFKLFFSFIVSNLWTFILTFYFYFSFFVSFISFNCKAILSLRGRWSFFSSLSLHAVPCSLLLRQIKSFSFLAYTIHHSSLTLFHIDNQLRTTVEDAKTIDGPHRLTSVKFSNSVFTDSKLKSIFF